MFCILSKNKNGTESAIAYFDSIEKAQNAIPEGTTSWYIKEIGELKPFLESLKKQNIGKYIVLDKNETSTHSLVQEKVSLYDNENDLILHNCNSYIKKEDSKKIITEKPLIKEPQNKENKKKYFSPRPKGTYIYKKSIPDKKEIKEIKEIHTIKHLDPIKKVCSFPTEENGKDWYRYSFYFIEIDANPIIKKTYIGVEEPYTTRTFVQNGYIYKDKGFSIIVYSKTIKDATEKMKSKLKELKKNWK